MRLDGGHPALDFVNTVYGQPDAPPEHDVLSGPEDLVTFARRVGIAGERTPASPAALDAARALRAALTEALQERTPSPILHRAVREAYAAGRLASAPDGALAWTWPDDDPLSPVHRLAVAAADLLTDAAALAHLKRCAGCCWWFLDRTRNHGRRWCSMEDCGTEAKKRRYVERRRAKQARR